MGGQGYLLFKSYWYHLRTCHASACHASENWKEFTEGQTGTPSGGASDLRVIIYFLEFCSPPHYYILDCLLVCTLFPSNRRILFL